MDFTKVSIMIICNFLSISDINNNIMWNKIKPTGKNKDFAALLHISYFSNIASCILNNLPKKDPISLMALSVVTLR